MKCRLVSFSKRFFYAVIMLLKSVFVLWAKVLFFSSGNPLLEVAHLGFLVGVSTRRFFIFSAFSAFSQVYEDIGIFT